MTGGGDAKIMQDFAAIYEDSCFGEFCDNAPPREPMDIDLRLYPFVPIKRTIIAKPALTKGLIEAEVDIPTQLRQATITNGESINKSCQVYYRQSGEVELVNGNLVAVEAAEFDSNNPHPLTPQYYVVARDLSEFNLTRETHLVSVNNCQVTLIDNNDKTLLEVTQVQIQFVAAKFAQVAYGHCRVYCDELQRKRINGTLIIDWYNDVLEIPEQWVIPHATTIVGPQLLLPHTAHMVCPYCEQLTLCEPERYIGHLTQFPDVDGLFLA